MLRILKNFDKAIRVRCFLSNLNQFQHSMPFYAVAAGWEVGIFDTWDICEKKVKQYSNPVFKKFKTRAEAEAFLRANGVSEGSAALAGASDPRKDAIPLSRTPTKKKHSEHELRKLVEQKKLPQLNSSSRLSSKQCGSENETQLQVTKSQNKVKEAFWPDDVETEEDDNVFLLNAVAEVEGISEDNTLKRKSETEARSSSSKISKKYTHESRIWEPIGLKKIGNFEFPIDSEGFVVVYTDGSCKNNGKPNAVAGFGVYFCEFHPLNAGKPVKGRVTNNAGEIQAAIYAIQIAKDFGIKKLCLSTDSQFLINAVTAWIKGWKRKGWKLKDGQPVKNKDDFVILDRLLDKTIQIKWNYVKGHKGIVGNEKADELARQGADLYKSR